MVVKSRRMGNVEKKTGPKHKTATEGGEGGGHTDAIVLSLWRLSTNEEKGEPLDQSKIPDAVQRAKKRKREAQAARDKTPGRGKHRSAHPGDVREAQIIGQALTRERTLAGQHLEGGGKRQRAYRGLNGDPLSGRVNSVDCGPQTPWARIPVAQTIRVSTVAVVPIRRRKSPPMRGAKQSWSDL